MLQYTYDDRKVRLLTVLDEYTQHCLAIDYMWYELWVGSVPAHRFAQTVRGTEICP